MTRIRLSVCMVVVLGFLCSSVTTFAQSPKKSVSLFDGTSFSGWRGDTAETWRIESGTIVAGSMDKPAARNEFLCTEARYSDFDLTLEFKIVGTEKLNAGVQFRTELIREEHAEGRHAAEQYSEVCGYQADIGTGYHGCLYDESRRRKVLARPDEKVDEKVSAGVPRDGWQRYRIRAVGNRIQLWLNGVPTVDYTETDKSIPNDGIIALQIHGNMVGTIAYRNILLQDLSTGSAKSMEDFRWISGHWTGEALGGKFEETWSPPLGGEMMGMFKLVKDGKVAFYELLTIVPENESYVLRLKHFNQGLVGWEEKDKSVEFPFVSASPTKVVFKGLVFSRDTKFSRDRMKITVSLDGNKKPLVFNCKRNSLP